MNLMSGDDRISAPADALTQANSGQWLPNVDSPVWLAWCSRLTSGPAPLSAKARGFIRQAQYGEPLVTVLPVKRFETRELRRETALSGDIDDHQHLAAVIAERLLSAVDRGAPNNHKYPWSCWYTATGV